MERTKTCSPFRSKKLNPRQQKPIILIFQEINENNYVLTAKFLHCIHDEQSDRVTRWLTNRGGTQRVCFCPCCSGFEPRPLNWDQPGRSTELPTPSEDGPYYAGGPPYTPDREKTCRNNFGDVVNNESDVRAARKVRFLTSIM